MRKSLICCLAIIGVLMLVRFAIATPILYPDRPEDDLQDVLNNITVGPNAGVSSVNVTEDFVSDEDDSLWSISGAGGSIATIIIELASNANTNVLGIYDAVDLENMVEIFDGSAQAGSLAMISIRATGAVYKNLFINTGIVFDGNLFGFYLDTRGSGGEIWYSDTLLNTDEMDHMFAYQGTNTDTVQIGNFAPGIWSECEYVLAFEDQDSRILSDEDYNDFVVMVESVYPVPPVAVPEPSTIFLILGLTICTACIGMNRFKG